MNKNSTVEISAMCGTRQHADWQGVLWNITFFDILVTTSFGVNNLENTQERRLIFFQNVQYLIYISKFNKIHGKKYFVF